MPRYIMIKMTKDVDQIVDTLLEHADYELSDPPVQDEDIVLLVGHGGGEYNVQFINHWLKITLNPETGFHPKNKTFVLLMCGHGKDGGSAQMAELIASQGGTAIWADGLLMPVYVGELARSLGDLNRQNGASWPIAPNAVTKWNYQAPSDGGNDNS